jgi:hypothetical protein
LKNREEKEEEIRQLVKTANKKRKETKSHLSFSDWFKSTQNKEEETE